LHLQKITGNILYLIFGALQDFY